RGIQRYTRGVPRLINLVCDRALMAAYAHGLREVSSRMVGVAVRELAGMPARSGSPVRRLVYMGGLFLVLAVASAIFAWWMAGQPGGLPH
ncbi:MAG TPA: hypothetical protein VFA48_14550, partial [Gammaproteobacteria bacterium]|nr:hypothetical protein [Gammaproteobacteria bacterium]